MKIENNKARIHSRSGFTLLEVLMSLGILTSMVVAISSMIRSNFDVREGVSNQNRVTHRLNIALERITRELAEAYVVPVQDYDRGIVTSRNMGTLFRIEQGSQTNLTFTTLGYRSIRRNSGESDVALVSYKIVSDTQIPGRSHLYRTVKAFLDADLKELPEGELFVRNIKSLELEFWRGDGWSKDQWDSGRSDTRGLTPHLVKVSVEAWTDDLGPEDKAEAFHEQTVKASTIVYLSYSGDLKELKERGRIDL